MIKVIIADDHKLIRSGLRKICENELDISIIGETDNPFAVPDLVKNSKPDVLILDLNFPQKSGFELLKDILSAYPETKVLILSLHPEDRYALRTLRAGASGYISKESNPELIIEAIRKIYSGKKYISPELSGQLIDMLQEKKGATAHDVLSDREFQILCFLAEGKSQKKIADELMLSASTVNTYRARILEKLHLSSNAELIHYALENGLIDRN